MGQYACKAYPGVYFFFVQLVVDVVQGEDAQVLPADGDIADADGKVHGAAFVAECRLELVAGTAGGEHIHQVIVHT